MVFICICIGFSCSSTIQFFSIGAMVFYIHFFYLLSPPFRASLSIRVFLEEFKKLQKYFHLFGFFSNLFQRPLTVSLVHNEITPPPAAITTTKVSFKENVK